MEIQKILPNAGNNLLTMLMLWIRWVYKIVCFQGFKMIRNRLLQSSTTFLSIVHSSCTDRNRIHQTCIGLNRQVSTTRLCMRVHAQLHLPTSTWCQTSVTNMKMHLQTHMVVIKTFLSMVSMGKLQEKRHAANAKIYPCDMYIITIYI